MAWIGKFIGGLLGLSLGGPLGLIAGIAFGNLFDHADTSGNQQTFYNHSYMNQNDSKNLTFFVGVFSLLARLAQSDGQVSSNERRVIEQFIDKDLALDYNSKQAALRIFEVALTKQGTPEQFAKQVYDSFYHDPAILQLVVDILFRVAVADGSVSKNEEAILRTVTRVFHYSPSYFEAMCRKYSACSTSEGAYTVLGLTSSATNEEVKKAYRRMSIEYHPDTVQANGVPDDFVKVATKKFREIQEAYEVIKKERHIK